MTFTHDDRIHAWLDGDLPREALTPEEQQLADSLSDAAQEVARSVRSVAAPDLTARVMAGLPPEAAAAVAPEPRGERGVLVRAARWLWSPMPVTLRPAYALAGAMALLVAALLVNGLRSQPALPLAPVAASPEVDPALYVQFRIELSGASRVALAGSFTDWQPEHELTEISPGVWSVMIALHPGVHDYTFVVDGKKMVVDPHAPRVADSFGGSNSRLFLPTPNGSA